MAKKRRTRTSHPGVKIRQRTWASGAITYFARWVDPDTEKEVDTNLNKLGLTNAEARREWAIVKSKHIKARTAAIAAGVPKKTRTPIPEAIKDYLEQVGARSRAGTVANYSVGLRKFEDWCRDRGLKLLEDLRGPHLAAFRAFLASGSRLDPVRGGKRGRRMPKGQPLSPASVNSYLRATKAFLNCRRKLGLAPGLDRDAIGDSLNALKTPKEKLDFLGRDALRQVLTAALAHDAANFTMTRAEHDGLKRKGTTPRYDPIAPLVSFLLLSGCRVGEAIGLDWSSVDLMAANDLEQPPGAIELRAAETKTGHARRINLGISPALRGILLALEARRNVGRVFPMSQAMANKARKRLVSDFGASTFTWQTLRRTAGSFLTCAPGIFGQASAFMSAKQLGHSVAIAERYYLGVIHGVPHEARTLEAAMGAEDLFDEVVARIARR